MLLLLKDVKGILRNIFVDLGNDLKAIDKELEEALNKQKKARELLPKVEMVLSNTKNPNVRKAFENYFEYLKRQSDTDDTFLFNSYKGAGIGLAEGTIEFYAAEVLGTATVALAGISMLFRGDTRIETPKENKKNSYIPKENRITITSSEALKLKKFFPDYYTNQMGYYNVLGLVENDGIPRNTSTLENDPRISEDIAAYYNGERSKLENKGYVVGNIVGNIAGYKLASKGAFYKNNSTYTSVQNGIENVGDTAKTVRKNEQQAQKVQNSVVQNNKNSINKTQPQGNQDYSGNQQVSKGATSNNQQGAPVSKTSDINKSGVSQVAAPPSYLTKPEQGGTLVIGAGNKPIKGAYNVDIKENIKIGVFKGDATNLVNVPTGSQSKVIIENPNGFDPLNPEILRVVKEGGEIEITGIKSNKEFFKIYSGEVEVPKGFEIIEVGEIPENFQKQGFRTNGDLIGQKNGVGTPKKTDKIIRIRKIKK